MSPTPGVNDRGQTNSGRSRVYLEQVQGLHWIEKLDRVPLLAYVSNKKGDP